MFLRCHGSEAVAEWKYPREEESRLEHLLGNGSFGSSVVNKEELLADQMQVVMLSTSNTRLYERAVSVSAAFTPWLPQ